MEGGGLGSQKNMAAAQNSLERINEDDLGTTPLATSPVELDALLDESSADIERCSVSVLNTNNDTDIVKSV